uniref:Ribonuclease H-like domain-containing protein n=1 Tax=Tanacetum cinerariifolium TaxID=118510 RepID=A0A699I3S0_TANCI|nr:ribonuclease H-like domain-containing protein [Tanacetum cinerariifolium]
MNCHVTTTSPLPRSHVHALHDPNRKEAMLDEYNALITNGTWVLIPRSANVNVVRSMWLFKHKFNADGSLSGYKARLHCLQHFYSGSLLPSTLHLSSTTQLSAYTDADWAGCPVTRRSISGFNLLSWSAKRQIALSRSSDEANRGVANVVAETAWIRNLLCELHTPLFIATLVYCDNVSAVYLSTNLVQHQRTKHIEIDINFVRDYVTLGQVRVLYVPSRFQYADIFTKGLPTALFLEFRSSLNVRRPPTHTAGEY